ncbi:rhophilin-1 isoform X2 [Cricetulus griseus]|uniref:rhophilin-1 isoform X2 n=1 Tax=Cricetulus griseus TaxID=10029 RepID=UPI00022F5FC2|nr:rhophilin-1 isoform X2 [Cricetulus griseus]
MILEERPDGPGAGEDSNRLQDDSSIRKDCDSMLPEQPCQLQNQRARLHQQITKELRMRTGRENLYRATSNTWVRETVALELSFVNSNLQLLKEELAELSSSMDMDQPEGESVTIPMIPLGLKETKELDWATPLKELISEHFEEDGTSYETEIQELEDLRQATRTPSRDEVGLDLLAAYYSQLCFLDARFFSPARSPRLLFHWYDSLTGVPAQQQALAFEKGSVLFNIGALHTQIGARQDCSCTEGTIHATEAFQRAAGAFRLLRENFSHAPSLDMSTASLSMLEQLMVAQAQECIFKGLLLPASDTPDNCPAQLQLAQEAAQVAAEYRLVHRAMAQPPVQDYLPTSWTNLAHVKSEHFCALAHYHAAMALCEGSSDKGEVSRHIFQPSTTCEPQGPTASSIQKMPQHPEERRKLAKAHLKRAILGQEEALRLHTLCRVLRKVDLLQVVVTQALRCSLAKYSELEREDDFFEAVEAPNIQPKTHQAPEVKMPSLSQMKVTDLFHRLGPLSVFSTKNRWRLVGPVHMIRGEGGFGFTLRGDSPVLIAAVVPGGQAESAGLKEGDYIVSVNGRPCKWWKHVEVVAQLRGVGEGGVSLQVVSMLPSPEPRSTGPRRAALLWSQKECGFETAMPARARPWPILGWGRKTKQSKTGCHPDSCTNSNCVTCP